MSADGRFRWSGQALLFDLDGTLVDSHQSVLRAWRATAEHVGVDFAEFERYTHGIPAQQVFALVTPEASAADVLDWSEQLLHQQAEDTDDIIAIAGAVQALDQLPLARWAIVTSGDARLAQARIKAAGIAMPKVLISADDVLIGKPDPAPYLMGASRLGALPEQCLVFEDVWAGVEAGRAAGMPVVGVLSSVQALDGVVHSITDFTELAVETDRVGVHVRAR